MRDKERMNCIIFLRKKIFIVSKQKNRQKYKRLIYTTYINYIQKKNNTNNQQCFLCYMYTTTQRKIGGRLTYDSLIY